MINIFLFLFLDDEYHFIELDTKLSKFLPKSSKSRRKQVRNVTSASCFIHQALSLFDYIKQFSYLSSIENTVRWADYFCNFCEKVVRLCACVYKVRSCLFTSSWFHRISCFCCLLFLYFRHIPPFHRRRSQHNAFLCFCVLFSGRDCLECHSSPRKNLVTTFELFTYKWIMWEFGVANSLISINYTFL